MKKNTKIEESHRKKEGFRKEIIEMIEHITSVDMLEYLHEFIALTYEYEDKTGYDYYKSIKSKCGT